MTNTLPVGTEQLGAFYHDEFPLAPESVIHAHEHYWQVTHEPIDEQSRKMLAMSQTNGLISDFCDSYLTPQIYSAAMLASFADEMSDDLRRRNALRGLKTFYELSDETPEDKRFILGLLSDRPIIHDFWQQQTEKLYADDPERLALLTDTTNTAPVPAHMWDKKPLGSKASDILQLRIDHGINIETFLIESAETLQWLQSPLAGNDAATLQKIHVADALYAPFCEIIGFDGLAMALQGRCMELRLINTGHADAVEQARQIIDSMGTPEVIERRVQKMLRALVGDNIQEQVLAHMMPHGIVVGEGLVLDSDTRIIWRLKTVGSLGRKLAFPKPAPEKEKDSDREMIAMDIAGITLIPKDAHQVGLDLAAVTARAKQDPRATLTPSPTRTKSLHVKGTPEYIDAVRQAMGYPDLQAMEEEVDIVQGKPGCYQVAKATLKFQQYGEPWPMHAEIQFNTVADRIEARIGSAAHALFKLTGDAMAIDQAAEDDEAKKAEEEARAKDIAALKELHARKAHLGQNGLTPLSRRRADLLQQRIALMDF